MSAQLLQLRQEQATLRLPKVINAGNMESFARAAREALDAAQFSGKVSVGVVAHGDKVTAQLAGTDKAALAAAKRLLTKRPQARGQKVPSIVDNIATALAPDAKGNVLPPEALETIIGSIRYSAEHRAAKKPLHAPTRN